ncbi:MAG TPA: hypothetical protein VFI44_09950, partial [Ornithinibacter sp.]|nr:hypothetical protein [Ornithinibacter sp.]
AAGNALVDIDRVQENGPAFQVWASYGTCTPPPGYDEGGCGEPVTASTLDWQPDLAGLWCRRLDPQLGVPTGEIMGELTLFTERVQVAVVDQRDREGEGGGEGVTHALALLDGLRPVGDTQRLGALPPPDPDIAAWVDELCGTVPGQSVEHPMEDLGGGLDNTHVPDFTVPLLGGGALAWAEQQGKPVVIAVGNLEQVGTALRRLAPVVTASPSGATLLGLVTELDVAKSRPRSIGELEQEAGELPAPVGYAAVPLPAVWFMDSAANLGQVTTAMETGLIALVDPSGEVVSFMRMNESDGALRDAVDALG